MAVTGVILLIYDAVKIQSQIRELEGQQLGDQATFFHVDPVFSPSFNGMTLTFDF